MRNISDVIEDYLKSIFEAENNKFIEIKRSEIANKFNCVPSQINYVINTRFTLESGYKVESKRGGGGFIRIIKIELIDDVDLIDKLTQLIGDEITYSQAEKLIIRLLQNNIVTKREARLMLKASHNNYLTDHTTNTNILRASILKAMLEELRHM